MTLSNSAAVGQSTAGSDQRDLGNEVEVDQILCYDSEFVRALSNSVQIGSYLTGYLNGLNWPQQGINPQPVIVFVGIWSMRLRNSVTAEQSLAGTGGLIYDESCSPVQLIPNFDQLNWENLTEDEWENMDENQWRYLL